MAPRSSALTAFSIFAALLLSSNCHAASSLYDLSVFDIEGRPVSLQKYAGTVSLVVNVASFCGLTQKNYAELAKLQNHFGPRGFQVLAFPCNQFNLQEPKTNAEIERFARVSNATFPMFAKTTVNDEMCLQGAGLAPCMADSQQCCAPNNNVFSFLKTALPGKVDWNFAKFLVSATGAPLKRYAPSVTPLELVPDIEAALGSVLQSVS